MELTDDQTRIDIVAKLVKDGAIDFNEALDLLKKDQPPVFVYPTYPFDWNPGPPFSPVWQQRPWEITCQTQN